MIDENLLRELMLIAQRYEWIVNNSYAYDSRSKESTLPVHWPRDLYVENTSADYRERFDKAIDEAVDKAAKEEGRKTVWAGIIGKYLYKG